MDNRENDTVIKMFLDNIKEKPITDKEHQRAMSNEFDYLDKEENDER